MSYDHLATFRVRNAGTMTGFAIFLILAGQIPAVLGILIGLTLNTGATGGLRPDSATVLLVAGLVATVVGVGCAIAGFCTNVEYLVRAEVERRGGASR